VEYACRCPGYLHCYLSRQALHAEVTGAAARRGRGIAASAIVGLETAGVSVVGSIQGGFPLPQLPQPGLFEAMWPAAAGIALISFTESIAAARAFERPADPPINANRELFALGAANAAGAFIGSMPAGGGTSQTAVALKAVRRRRPPRWWSPRWRSPRCCSSRRCWR